VRLDSDAKLLQVESLKLDLCVAVSDMAHGNESHDATQAWVCAPLRSSMPRHASLLPTGAGSDATPAGTIIVLRLLLKKSSVE
jgi:hypothetical protein